MARQNTFTIVPQAPRFHADAATTTTPARPMTSKQVRQAYKAATKTPTLTRAERRQWEREEQERIRKELEKERAAAKARAVREKKKEKEAQQREEKRRSGMPLVNVRPSQDTIARFVRGNGSTRKRDAEGLVVTTAQTAESEKQDEADATTPEADSMPPRAVAHVLGSIVEIEENLDDEAPANVTTEERRRAKPDDNATKRTGVEEKQTTVRDETTDKTIEQATAAPFQDFDVDLSFEEPIDEEAFDAALDLIPAFGAGQLPGLHPAGAAEKEAAILTPSQDLLDEDINTDMLEELDELLSRGKTPAKPAPAQATASHQAIPRHALHQPTTPGQGKPRFPSQQRKSSPRQMPPMATQAILSNADDFFPTLSQQMRELEEEQEASQKEVVQPLAHRAQQRSTPRDDASSKGASKYQPVRKSGGTGESDSGFGSFPSTTQFSSSPPPQQRRSSSRIQRQASVSSVHESVPAAAPEPPRFFTSSGSREQLALALQRSRRSAALEQIQRKERQRQEAGQLLLMRQAEDGAAHRRRCSAELERRKEPTGTSDKENGPPEMRCSQETEYGGDWVEDAAWDLALC